MKKHNNQRRITQEFQIYKNIQCIRFKKKVMIIGQSYTQINTRFQKTLSINI